MHMYGIGILSEPETTRSSLEEPLLPRQQSIPGDGRIVVGGGGAKTGEQWKEGARKARKDDQGGTPADRRLKTAQRRLSLARARQEGAETPH